MSIQPIITTAGLERLVRFYCDVFDATESMRYPKEGDTFYAVLQIGTSELGIVARADAPTGPQRLLISIGVDDVDAALDRVERFGGTGAAAKDMPWGQRVAHIQDPDGNTVNLTQQL
ncbi:VOC family protein [Pseudonocardia hispaniensis]|uniref:VOC family protein n=1 Tax=Pseudonocardia hispaniensis TaxID=904933 RepID=A0ABW1J3V6_9PSEU